MTRREFFKTTLALGLSVATTNNLWAWANEHNSTTSLESLILKAQKTPLKFHESIPATELWSFAKDNISPELRFKQGDVLKLQVDNDLTQEITVHWHGLRVPNAMDGVPNITQDPIKKYESFNYEFPLQDAGTYWYHTHSNSPEQLGRGLAGALIIEEANGPKVDADMALLIQDWRLDNDAQIVGGFNSTHDMAHSGRLGNVVTVNGEIQPTLDFAPNARVRLRFINASSARVYVFDLPKWSAWTVALDGQAVPPAPYEPIPLGPGMRLDVIVDMPEKANTIGDVNDNGYDSYTLLKLNTKGDTLEMHSEAPERIADNPIAMPDLFDAQRHNISIEGGAMSPSRIANSIWGLNGKGYQPNETEPLLELKQNKSYILSIKNDTAFTHPMHLHGHTFLITSLNKASLGQPRFSDTLFLQPREEAEIAFVADNPGDWMFHCHVLGHQASGMMAVFRVA